MGETKSILFRLVAGGVAGAGAYVLCQLSEALRQGSLQVVVVVVAAVVGFFLDKIATAVVDGAAVFLG